MRRSCGYSTGNGEAFYLAAPVDTQPRPKPQGHDDLSTRWVGAGHLKVGDKIKQADGTTGTVTNVITVEQTQEMFNLTVDEAHTFYVGVDGWLVHNGCFEDYIEGLRKWNTPTTTNSGIYEIAYTGPYKYRVPVGNTGLTYDIDGFAGRVMLDAKYIHNTARSPFIPNSSAPQFLKDRVKQQLLSEFSRAGQIMDDPASHFQGYRIITNNTEAAKYFRGLLKQAGANGTVVIRK